MPGTGHTAVNKEDKIISLVELGEASWKQIHTIWTM